MTLRLVEPADDLPVSVEFVRRNSRVEIEDEDELIEAYIRAAADYAQKYTGVALEEQTWELVLSGFPSGAITLPLSPVIRVVSVTRDGDALPVDDYWIDASGIDPQVSSAAWPEGTGEVVVRFIAGGETPASIRQAVILLASHWINNREAASADGLQSIPFGVTALLDLNRRMFV